MDKKNKFRNPNTQIPNQGKYATNPLQVQPTPLPPGSLLNAMVDGREFQSIVELKPVSVQVVPELKLALKDISTIRQRPVIAYLANVVNQNIKAGRSIEYSDDLPFSELVNTIPLDAKEIDIILITPGGSATQVAKFVDKLRPKFDSVTFIIPDIAMSAGTIFAMSGDDIIMTDNSYLGPIDPQVLNKDGIFMPAQAILTLINQIQTKGNEAIAKGLNPDWTDLQILRQIDPKDIGNAINASKYSVELVENYLHDFKFKKWEVHSNGSLVTEIERKQRANEIANQLCNHSLWKLHGRGITRDAAQSVCKLKITYSEKCNLDRAIKRFWALLYWVFEKTAIYKTFISENYCLIRNDKSILINPK